MKNTDKNSQNRGKQSDGTLIYVLLLFLVVLLIGGGIWVWHEWQKEPQKIYDYKTELGERLVNPTAEEVKDLMSGNRNRLKTIERFLNDQMKGRKLTDSEKAKVREELKNVDKGIFKSFRGNEFKNLEKDYPELLDAVYSQLYEQGKILTRLKSNTAVNRSDEEVLKQLNVIQPNWGVDKAEEEEATKKLDEWIRVWYNQAMAKVLSPQQKKLTEFIKPIWVGGKKVKNNYSQEDIAFFRKEWVVENKKTGIEVRTDLSQPLQIKFNGYTGFLNQDDFKKSGEGKETFGVTISPPKVKMGKKKYEWFLSEPNNCRQIEIKLKKELFFNRLGYEEWIKSVKKTKNGKTRNYFDICFGEVAETIAHELAHAVVNSIEGDYEGEEGGGHGELFYDLMEKIEKMMRKTPEFDAFEKWWDKTKNDQN